MKKSFLIYAIGIFILTGSCKEKEEEQDPRIEKVNRNVMNEMGESEKVVEEEVKTVKFKLEAKSDSKATGEAWFTEEKGRVTFEARLTGLTPGEHAIHIHEKADCSAPDGTSAGGHWNPTYAEHGKWGSADGYHKGDIGNFTADEKGNGSIRLTTGEWCVDCDDDSKNVLGKSVIVHSGADDFVSQPSGNAGKRVSCGGIIQ